MKCNEYEQFLPENKATYAQFASEIYEAFHKRIGALITPTKQEQSEEFSAGCVMVLRVSCIGCLPRSKQQELKRMLSSMSFAIGGSMKFQDTDLSIQVSAKPESVCLVEAGGAVESKD